MEANTPGGYDKGLGTTSTPGQNRTGDLAFRKRLLYPTELRGHAIVSTQRSTPAVHQYAGLPRPNKDRRTAVAARHRRQVHRTRLHLHRLDLVHTEIGEDVKWRRSALRVRCRHARGRVAEYREAPLGIQRVSG